MIRKGKIKGKSFPSLTDWDLMLIEFYSICVNEDGINLSNLEIVFKTLGIKDKALFYETVIILTRSYHYTRGLKNA